MSENSMVERVARAIHFRGDDQGNDAWNYCQPWLRDVAKEQARAAIEAMREPDRDTLARALHDIEDRRGAMRESVQVFREFHRAMIDAGLSDERIA